jgi:protease II
MSAKAKPPSEDDKMDLRYREEILLDENEEARGHSYFDLGAFKARGLPFLWKQLC